MTVETDKNKNVQKDSEYHVHLTHHISKQSLP